MRETSSAPVWECCMIASNSARSSGRTERPGYPRRAQERRRRLDLGKQYRKLIAAQSPDRVVGAQGPLQGSHDPAQQLVAGCVSVPVVDELEVIDVEHEHGSLPAASHGDGY